MYNVEEVKGDNDLLDIALLFSEMKKSGKEWVGCCPIHQENTPSFYVNQHKQSYYCFGCGSGGDVVDLVRKIKGLDFPEAMEFLGGENTKEVRPVQISPIQFEKPAGGIIDRESVEFITDPKFYKHNPLFVALCKIFPPVDVQRVFEMYHIGTTKNTWGNDRKIATVFYQRSVDGNYNVGIRTHYKELKRCKDTKPNHMKPTEGATDYILFGEHLAMRSDNIFIVESEKTCIIMTLAGLCLPSFAWAKQGMWMATTGQQKLKTDILTNLKRKAIILVPDQDAVYDKKIKNGIIKGWLSISNDFDKNGYCVSLYNCKELSEKEDIADLVIKHATS